MTCTWMRAPGGWAVVIPESELLFEHGGLGYYAVTQRDGSTRTVYVESISQEPQWMRGELVRLGREGDPHHETSAKRAALSHAPPAKTTPRLSKDGHAVIAPESVLDKALDPNGDSGMLYLDGKKVWVEEDGWAKWYADGVRMVRAPVKAVAA